MANANGQGSGQVISFDWSLRWHKAHLMMLAEALDELQETGKVPHALLLAAFEAARDSHSGNARAAALFCWGELGRLRNGAANDPGNGVA